MTGSTTTNPQARIYIQGKKRALNVLDTVDEIKAQMEDASRMLMVTGEDGIDIGIAKVNLVSWSGIPKTQPGKPMSVIKAQERAVSALTSWERKAITCMESGSGDIAYCLGIVSPEFIVDYLSEAARTARVTVVLGKHVIGVGVITGYNEPHPDADSRSLGVFGTFNVESEDGTGSCAVGLNEIKTVKIEEDE